MYKVLIFESDVAFARELQADLEARSYEVTVVDEASLGLQTAAANRPDLILLAVELPRMSGFSVCGKLKRDGNLQNVPLIIMSTDATEETFEQHKRLRTRAEDYVHKPISVADLHHRIAALLGTENAANDAILIDDDVDFEIDVDDAPSPQSQGDAERTLAAATEISELVAPNDNESARFADQALGALLDDEHSNVGLLSDSRVESGQQLPPVTGSRRAPADVDSLGQQLAIANAELDNARSRLSTLDRAASELERANARIRELEHGNPEAMRITELEAQLSQLTFRAEQAESKVIEHENKLRAAPKFEDLQKLQRDLDEARAKGGATARDFLELREQINRKDKEMLDLRDQLTGKDKELLSLRDTNLAQERAQADLGDKVAELEKHHSELQRSSEALRADKEQAAKRADDFKKRSEKVSAELEALSAERRAERERHEQESSAFKTHEATLRAEHEQTLQQVQSEQANASAAAAQQARDEAVSAAQVEFDRVRGEHSAAMNQARDEHAMLLSQAQQEKDSALNLLRDEAERSKAEAVQLCEQELKREHDNTLAALHRAGEAQLEQQRAAQQAAIEQTALEHSAAINALMGELQELRQRNQYLQGAMTETTGALGQAKESLQAVVARLTEICERSV